jgi:hypothetical protein
LFVSEFGSSKSHNIVSKVPFTSKLTDLPEHVFSAKMTPELIDDGSSLYLYNITLEALLPLLLVINVLLIISGEL